MCQNLIKFRDKNSEILKAFFSRERRNIKNEKENEKVRKIN